MNNVVYTNEWTSPHIQMPPVGREVLVKIEIPLKNGNFEIAYGGVLRWNGINWVDANTNTKENCIVYKWYMFERDTKDKNLYK